jgi:hypothetical protein
MANLILPGGPLGWVDCKRKPVGELTQEFGTACPTDLMSRNRNVGTIHEPCLPDKL